MIFMAIAALREALDYHRFEMKSSADSKVNEAVEILTCLQNVKEDENAD